ncbi:ATP-binding protein [Sphingomonas sp. BAUL-RG-20F-R05-02]|jgi:Cdc6-like AAA superfamily ATPase|uniref:ATP-binding protein n=1 Tax=Sphingomonas sp. BAUL-RG-20F-R05-02 TaxID=2914830 RepID=UPI001F5937D0|nr:ATP-binding protein [Sphingomonas sp. BAUL-RG-20F-R05-02]
MTRLDIKNWVEKAVHWFEGGRAPRKLDALLLDRPVPSGDRFALASHREALDGLGAKEPIAEQTAGLGDTGFRLDRVKVAQTFDSAHPVRSRSELFGRALELDAMLSATVDFGQHVIIHGARGSGKTSLVRVFGDHADGQGAVVIYMACEPDVSFAALARPYLQALPTTALVPQERAHFQSALAALPETFGPRAFVELVAERVSGPVILIFDEFDRITDTRVKAEMAVAMKLLSDALANVLFVLVGIAHSVSDVIDCHPSLRRHMRVVSLGRIEADSVKELIDAGEATTGLVFKEEARVIIGRASCGSPFHVRMFCHHAAIAALMRGSSSVSGSDARRGLRSAIEQWAAMNREDAQYFLRLVESGVRLPEIEEVAHAAALVDKIPDENESARALLGDTIVVEENGAQTFVFRDSVAPQFLIAYVILAEAAVGLD